jgi:hypothetical protein
LDHNTGLAWAKNSDDSLFNLGHVGHTLIPGLPAVPGLVVVMATVVADVIVGRLVFPAATGSSFFTAGSAIARVTSRLVLPVWLSMMVLV